MGDFVSGEELLDVDDQRLSIDDARGVSMAWTLPLVLSQVVIVRASGVLHLLDDDFRFGRLSQLAPNVQLKVSESVDDGLKTRVDEFFRG